ncbi:Auxin-responsive protein IAA26 [Linum grandiflorum]
MEGGCSKAGEACPKLLDLISKERVVSKGINGDVLGNGRSSSVEKKLELRLGLPGDDEWFSMGYFSHGRTNKVYGHEKESSSSQPCCTKVVDLNQTATTAEKKAFSSQAAAPSTPAHTAVPNISQKRTAPGPVVGWPPIRSFRKNLAGSSSSKPSHDDSSQPNKKPAGEKKPVEVCKRGMFVKINMDGVPIGRKVDLAAYDSYSRLSTAVDELFRDLLAAQRDCSVEEEEQKEITGLLDGSGEYTLVYEDNEGDRMLVGDVPWHMFVSTVKRLRVLKSSEVSALLK